MSETTIGILILFGMGMSVLVGVELMLRRDARRNPPGNTPANRD